MKKKKKVGNIEFRILPLQVCAALQQSRYQFHKHFTIVNYSRYQNKFLNYKAALSSKNGAQHNDIKDKDTIKKRYTKYKR